MTGIDVLESQGFSLLRGQRVGLLTHPAGVTRSGRSSIEVLHRSPQVNLVALFGPEHGIYGDEKANVPIQDRIDPRTQLPVFSLYGQFRKPTAQMLSGIDTLVVDLQDVGSRSYTYISCMRYAMEACFEQGKRMVVADRPNPIGGLKIDGPWLEKEWMSYVGAFPMPYVHALTIGEIARMAKMEPGVMPIDNRVRQQGQLEVVPMRGWNRSTMWTDTGMRWVPTSPAIPDLSAAMGYAMTGLGCQLGGFSHGYGTRYPFRLLQYSGRSPEAIAERLKQRRIPGLDFRVLSFQENRQPRRGTYVMVQDWHRLRPTEISFHLMAVACEWSRQNPFAAATRAQQDLFTKHVGEGAVLQALIQQGANFDIQPFLQRWERQNHAYAANKVRWHLYR
jgi:uncharacterized protein YbbC (DUF1343 family)